MEWQSYFLKALFFKYRYPLKISEKDLVEGYMTECFYVSRIIENRLF